jgi:hypothetical protein
LWVTVAHLFNQVLQVLGFTQATMVSQVFCGNMLHLGGAVAEAPYTNPVALVFTLTHLVVAPVAVAEAEEAQEVLG